MDVDFYAQPGPWTELSVEQADLVARLGDDPVVLCAAAQGLLISPLDAQLVGLPGGRMAERNIRPAHEILRRVLELDAAQLDHGRPPAHRVVGTCRHFAVLATAFLRSRRVPARARCGFAAYFMADKKVDHWVTEVWSSQESRWVRIDPEYLGRSTPGRARPEDLRPDEFLSAGEAWRRVRSGDDDPASYGVFGTANWGPGEIRGNAMRDLASLAAKLEPLPWDEWGPMAASYDGATGPEFDALIDEVAAAIAGTDPDALEWAYRQLAVPEAMIASR